MRLALEPGRHEPDQVAAAVQRLHEIEHTTGVRDPQPLERRPEIEIDLLAAHLPVQLGQGFADLADLRQGVEFVGACIGTEGLVQDENAAGRGCHSCPVRRPGGLPAPRYGSEPWQNS